MRVGVLADLVEAARELDAAGLAATAGVHLRLDDPEVAAELLSRLDGRIGRLGWPIPRGTGMPYSANNRFDWYSCRFIVASSCGGNGEIAGSRENPAYFGAKLR